MDKKIFYLTLFVLFNNYIYSAAIIYQAESGTLNGTYVSNVLSGYQGSGYVDGFDNAGDYCQVTVNVSNAGMYTITLGYAATMGQKINDLYVNGVFQASVTFPVSSGFTSVNAGIVPLNAGNNTIQIRHNWGWFYLDWFGVEAATLPPLTVSKTLVNPNSTNAAKCLMSYLVDNFGNKTISGQAGISDATWLYNNTGKYPALCGFDMMDYSPSRVERGAGDPHEVENAISWYQQGGIVQFQWHWNAPTCLYDTTGCEWWRGFYTECTCFDVEYAMNNPASQEYQMIIRDMDAIAAQLKRLRDAGVPVLWRPLHEAEGGWFWWGAKGANACKQLYYLMFDRFTNYHNLNNLIWVWTSTTSSNASAWYPGNNYVDVVGADIYLSGGDYSPSTSTFYGLFGLTGNQKLVAMTENGTIPDADAMVSQNAHWTYFMTWNGFENDSAQNSLSHVQSVFNHSYITTRDELGSIYNCILISPTITMTVTPTFSASRTLTRTPTPTWTQTQTLTLTRTVTSTLTITATQTATNSQQPTRTMTASSTATRTATGTWTRTATPSWTLTQTRTHTLTITPSRTETISPTHSISPTITQTWTGTPPSPTNTPTITETATRTRTATATASSTFNVPSSTFTTTNTATRTATPTTSSTFNVPSLTFTTTNTATRTATPTTSSTFNVPGSTFTITRTITASLTTTATWIITPTQTATSSQQPEIDNVLIFPNPYNPDKGNLKISFNVMQKTEMVKVRIYTTGYRLIKEIEFTDKIYNTGETCTKEITDIHFNGMANGIYYIIVFAKNSEGKETKSKPEVLIILK
ncbi:MAG: beta-mannanase [Candidatus Goldbacteria bacterium]|nr:beta-mannanase [Candidatus Goldiibacteriota bacterium]